MMDDYGKRLGGTKEIAKIMPFGRRHWWWQGG